MDVESSRLIVRNLPRNLDEQNLRKVFEPFGTVTDCRIISAGQKNRGFGFVGFTAPGVAAKARASLNKTYLGSTRLVVDFSAPRQNSRSEQNAPKEEELDPLRLYLTNLPFNVSAEEVEAELRKTGQPVSFRLLTAAEGRSQGRGFCSYAHESDTLSHLAKLDGAVFLGRVLRAERCLKFAGQAVQDAKLQETLQAERSSLKRFSKQKLLRRLEQPSTWGAMFLNPNVVMERIAVKLGSSRKAMLAEATPFAAVLQTLAEKEVLEETLEFLRASGLNTEALSAKPASTPRSATVIIVKNLPVDISHAELEKLFGRHGQTTRVLLSPNKAVGVVAYARADHAKNAFSLLGLYKLRSAPLYLEWAPAQLLPRGETELLAKRPAAEAAEATPVLVLKNLSFEVREEDIERVLRARGVREWRAVTVPLRQGKSVGYGFVEFGSPAEAARAQLALHGELLKGRLLEPLFSNSTRSTPKEERRAVAVDAQTTKLLVKNLAFNASKDELAELVSAIVAVKQVRMPRKPDNSSRGYAFLEFESVEECRAAFHELQNLHLYGRRLVVEFANA